MANADREPIAESSVQSRPEHYPILVFLILVFVFINLTLYIGTTPLFHEEPRRVIVAQEMILTRQYIVPKVFQLPYYTKPPLQNWLIAAVAARAGVVSNFHARVVSIIAFMILGIMVYRSLLQFGADIAFTAFVIVMTNYLMLCEYGNKAEPDMLLTLLTFSAFVCYMKNPVGLMHVAVSSVFVGLGILTKGVSMLYLYPGLTIHALLGPHDRLKRLGFLTVHALLACVLPGLWLMAYASHGDIPAMAAWFYTDVLGKTQGTFLQYIWQYTIFPVKALVVLLPWSAVLASTLKISRVRHEMYRASMLVMASTFLLLYLFVPWSGDRYLIPIFPFFAIVAAFHIDLHKGLPSAVGRIGLRIFSLLCLLAGIGFLGGRYYFNAAVFLLLGATSLSISKRRFTIMGFATAAALLFAVFFESGFYFARSLIQDDPAVVAASLVKNTDRTIPIAVDEVPIDLALAIERQTRQPVYAKDVADFERYYLITEPDRLDTRCEVRLQTTYMRATMPAKKSLPLSLGFCSHAPEGNAPAPEVASPPPTRPGSTAGAAAPKPQR